MTQKTSWLRYLFLFAVLFLFINGGSFNNKNINTTIKTSPNAANSSPQSPVLNSISPNPSVNGVIALYWNTVVGASQYYVYRSATLITSTTGLTPINTTSTTNYFDSVPTASTWYYAIVASNATGNSSVSNCASVNALYPAFSANSPLIAIMNASDWASYFTGEESFNPMVLYNGISALGYRALIINDSAIMSGILNSVSILVFVDNGPNDTASPLVKSWWQQGRGLLTFDSSICLDCWAGILPRESQGSNGDNTYWNYNSPVTGYVTNVSNPIMQGYTNGSIITGVNGNAEYIHSTMVGTSAGPYYTPLVQDSPTSPINDLVVAYQPPNNGTVVQCWDNTHWANAALQPMIVNTLNWMSSLAIISSILYPITPNPSYDGNVHLNWTPTASATSYYIFRNQSSFNSTLGLTPIATTNNLTYKDYIPVNGNYYYAIMANESGVNSTLSNCVNVTVQMGSPQISPVLQVASNISYNGLIGLSWNLISADNYSVFRNTSAINTTIGLIPQVITNATAFQDNITTAGTYFYALIATNIYGNSTLSNCVNCSIMTPLGPVLNTISPNPSYTGSISLSWGSSTGASQYFIFRNTTTITSVTGLNPIANTTFTSYIDTITINGTFYYAIIANSPIGNSSINNCVSIVISAPLAPTFNSISPSTSYTGSISLSWLANSAAINYYVYRNTSIITSTTGLPLVVNTTLISYTDTILSIGTYYYVVIANSPTGNSTISNCVNVNVTAPIAPTINPISPNPSTTGSISVTWNNLGLGMWYYLFRNTSPITNVSGLTDLIYTSATSYSDSISQNGTYYYAIIAHSAFGNSSFSTSVSVTVMIKPSNDLIIEDNDPWSDSYIETILTDNDMTCTIINETQIASVNLELYSRVIIPSSTEYNSLTAIVGAQSAKFEAYVNNGGILEIHAYTWESSPWPNGFPFGFQFYTSVEEDVNVVDSSSAIMNTPYVVTTSSLDNWDWSIGGVLNSTPAGTNDIINDTTLNEPVLIEYYSGAGMMLISTEPLEWGYGRSCNLLYNLLMYTGTNFLQLNQPSNLIYQSTSTGNTITWNPSSNIADFGTYQVFNNGSSFYNGTWSAGQPITVNVDGLSIGTYNFTIAVTDPYRTVWDTVWVTVVLNLPPTISAPPNMTYSNGTTGHTITWTITDQVVYTPTYTITRNSQVLSLNQPWIAPSAVISIKVDGLAPGVYSYVINASDGQLSAIDAVTVTVISSSPLTLTQLANVTISVNETSYILSWVATCNVTNGPTYDLYRNGTLIFSGAWLSGQTLSTNIAGFPIGTYVYLIVVYTGTGLTANDTVIVTINLQGATATTTSTPNGLDAGTIGLIIGICSIGAAIGVILGIRTARLRSKRPKSDTKIEFKL